MRDRAAAPNRWVSARRSRASASVVVWLALPVGVALVVWSVGGRPPVPALAFLSGLAMLVVVGQLLLRWGVWRWLAAAATVPVACVVSASARPLTWTTGAALLAAVVLLVLLWSRHDATRDLVLVTLGAALVGAVYALVLVGGDAAAQSWIPEWAPRGLLVVCAVAGLLGTVGLGRSRGSGLGQACLATVITPLVPVVAVGDWFLSVVLWPASAALGVTALVRGRRGSAVEKTQSDAVDEDTLARLTLHGDVSLAPVAVVIAAYNEAAGLEEVLEAIPSTLCGLPVDVVVVDDGSTDGTADAASSVARTLVARCGSNRGQGAALRLGYRVARQHGAQFVLTTDADGQYDPGDMEVVLAPVVSGAADFSTGSRVLGAQETHDLVRRTGVHVFAWTVRALTGARVTDTSFGLRAMRAAVTEAVTLNQPQYQSAELLIGVLSRGFRVVEVPARMHVRGAGHSKKGNNLVYGWRYARVVFGTWWREGCPRPVSETAPALKAE